MPGKMVDGYYPFLYCAHVFGTTGKKILATLILLLVESRKQTRLLEEIVRKMGPGPLKYQKLIFNSTKEKQHA
jgi:hypothetical protein